MQWNSSSKLLISCPETQLLKTTLCSLSRTAKTNKQTNKTHFESNVLNSKFTKHFSASFTSLFCWYLWVRDILISHIWLLPHGTWCFSLQGALNCTAQCLNRLFDRRECNPVTSYCIQQTCFFNSSVSVCTRWNNYTLITDYSNKGRFFIHSILES